MTDVPVLNRAFTYFNLKNANFEGQACYSNDIAVNITGGATKMASIRLWLFVFATMFWSVLIHVFMI